MYIRTLLPRRLCFANKMSSGMIMNSLKKQMTKFISANFKKKKKKKFHPSYIILTI